MILTHLTGLLNGALAVLRPTGITALACLLLPSLTFGATTNPVRITQLLCEYSHNPISLDTTSPHLGWILESSKPDQKQTAYHLLVATRPDKLVPGSADLWDSGRVNSADSVHVLYRGNALKARQRCFWKVRVWDAADQPSDWSDVGSWEMGLLGKWQARWIGAGPAVEPRPAAGFFKSTNELATVATKPQFDGRSTLLRKTFQLSKPLRSARAYATGLGYYELSCNGRRVGQNVLAPPKSNYRKWVFYDAYDLTQLLQPGSNTLGLHLGNGWFNPSPRWWDPYRMQWFGSKRALLQLHLDYTDGSSEAVTSDSSWETAPGPVLASCVYDGELYDAREERLHWDSSALSDPGAWQPAHIVEAPGGELVPCLMPAIRVNEHLRSIALTQPKPGIFIFDLGQNFAGWARLTAAGPRGTRITIRYAEDLHPDGTLDVTSNEGARATDVYLMKGEGRETYEPRFTFHGFRYVEVTGLPNPPELQDLLGCVVHNACSLTGSFTCANDLINRIHRATLWSQRSNLIGYPMDCPQRDERLGWFGDAMVSADEAMFNFDMPVFYRQWLEGVRFNQNQDNGDISIISPRPYLADEPDPTWSSAYLVMVWQYYLHYGDRDFLARHFEPMKRYVDFLGTQATNHILPKYWIGDWGTILEGWKEGEPVSVGTAFYYLDTKTVEKSATVLGLRNEAAKYAALAQTIKSAFQQAFFESAKKQFDHGSQFSNAFPLFLGLADPADQPAVLSHIIADLGRRNLHFNVGVLGAKYLLEALTQHGRADLAYALATQTGYPSWAHMLDHGQTTLSEFWDLHGSHNHIMMGSVDAWFYRTLAGIQLDELHPGFEHVFIKPFVPPSLSSVKASIQTVRGRLAVEWKQDRTVLELNVHIPVNAEATIYVPVTSTKKCRSKPALQPLRSELGAIVYRVGSGDYVFRAGK